MHLAIHLLLCFVAAPQPVSRAQAPSEPAGAPARESIDSLLEPVRKQFELPALAAAVVVGSNVVAIGATGERERGSGMAVTVDDLWHLGSCTKAMTATLAGRLVERGQLKWSSTVGEVFADRAERIDEAWRGATLEMLLQNRGGAPGAPPQDLWRALWKRTDAPHEARAWFVGELLARAPEVPPGSKFVYSNQGYMIAGAMLERAAGKPWEELMRLELFAPLGMSSAGFGAPGSVDAIDQPRGHTDKVILPGPGADNPAALGPAGTVHCSIGDWAKFAAAHLGGERGVASLVQPETFARLHRPPPGERYAMGWGREPRPWAGGDVLTHAGSNTMWYSVVWIAPEKDCAFVVVTNCYGDKARSGTDAAVAALLERQKLR